MSQLSGSLKLEKKLPNRIERLDCSLTFNEIFKMLKEKHKFDPENVKSVKVMVSEKDGDSFEVDEHEKLKTAFEIGPIKFINLMVLCEKVEISPPTPVKSAFEILMGKKRKHLDQMPIKDKKTELHNEFLMDLQADGPVLSGHCWQAEGHVVLKKMTDCSWYLDGRQKNIREASRKRVCEVLELPKRYMFCLYKFAYSVKHPLK